MKCSSYFSLYLGTGSVGYHHSPTFYCKTDFRHPRGLRKGYTLDTCRDACSNDKDCSRFDFTNLVWDGPAYCVLIPSSADCTLTSDEKWDSYEKTAGIFYWLKISRISILSIRIL